MTFEEFDRHTETLFEEIRQMRDTKGKEYAGDGDRFDNFNRLSVEADLTREKIWQVYFTKHWDAIKSFIKHGREFSDEKIHGRILDAIVYLMLLDGMIVENAQRRRANGGVPATPWTMTEVLNG